MKKLTKKVFAILLAMAMMLTACVAVSADTVYLDTTIDQEAVANLAATFGVPEDQMGMINPVISFMNALGITISTVDDGMELVFDLNGETAAVFGLAADEERLVVASNLFPDYVITMSKETMQELAQNQLSSIPGIGAIAGGDGEAAMDPEMISALSEKFGGYFGRLMAACMQSANIGEAEEGTFEFEGYEFGIKVPVTIDITVIATEIRGIVEDMFADETISSMIQGTLAAQGGEAVDMEELKNSILSMEDYYPDEVTAEMYINDDDSGIFYMEGRGTRDGNEEPFAEYNMLYLDEQNMSMTYTDKDNEMVLEFTLLENSMLYSYTIRGMYVGFGITALEGDPAVYHCDLYFLDEENPVACLDITTSSYGERTYIPDEDSVSEITAEEIMSGEGDAMNNLMTDVMIYGLGDLMTLVTEQVPEMGDLISAFTAGGSEEAAAE
jgi:hypothetical protein